MNINLNLGPKSGSSSSSNEDKTSKFANVGNKATFEDSAKDMLSIMDKYGASASEQGSKFKSLYNQNDLANELATSSKGCKLFNLNDYTSERVSSCNCLLN